MIIFIVSSRKKPDSWFFFVFLVVDFWIFEAKIWLLVAYYFYGIYLLFNAENFLFEIVQLCSSQVILQRQHAISVRFFANEAAPQALKGDG